MTTEVINNLLLLRILVNTFYSLNCLKWLVQDDSEVENFKNIKILFQNVKAQNDGNNNNNNSKEHHNRVVENGVKLNFHEYFVIEINF